MGGKQPAVVPKPKSITENQTVQFSRKANAQTTHRETKRTQTKALLGSNLPSSTPLPTSPGSEISKKRKLSLYWESYSGNNVLICRICRFEHISTKKLENIPACENCGARFTYEQMIVDAENSRCTSDAVDGVQAVIQESSNVSNRPLKWSYKGTPDQKSDIEKKELQILLNLISRFCENLSLAVRTACHSFSASKEFLQHLQCGRLRGKDNNRRKQSRQAALLELAAASLLISCRHYRSGITLKQIYKETKVPMTNIISRKKEIEALTGAKETFQESSLHEVLVRVCNLLLLPAEQLDAAQKTVDGALQLDLFRCSHHATVVAGCIYLVVRVADADRSWKEISDATCVSWYSIRKFYRILLPNAEQLLPQDYRGRYAEYVEALKQFYLDN